MNLVLRIACKGLTSHEQGLLSQQLKMLKGRTAYTWAYVGQREQAELMILRNPDEFGGRAQVYHLVDDRLNPTRTIEWPLRLFGLLELLVEFEKRPQAEERPAVELCEQLAGLSAGSLYRVGDDLIIAPGADLVLSRHDDFETALQRFSGMVMAPAPETLVPVSELSQFPIRHSFKKLLWSLAMRDGPRVDSEFRAPNTTFRLKAWPLLGEWQSSPPLLRLAALYTRKFASIERGMAFSGASCEQVQSFLFACKCCGIGLEARVEQQATVAAPSELTLLQRLRMRLGLGYGKSRQA